MTSTDPSGFSDETTGAYPIPLGLRESARDSNHMAELGAQINVGGDPIDFQGFEGASTGPASDPGGWTEAVKRLESRVPEDPCMRGHYDPEHAVVLPSEGPALWFVSGRGPGGRSYAVRVDDPNCVLFSDGEDRDDEAHRARLLLRALMDHARGMLEGGDYS